MPWTRKQVKYLLSSGSPLSSQQKSKMVGELHANPAMGHKQKGREEAHQERQTRSAARHKSRGM